MSIFHRLVGAISVAMSLAAALALIVPAQAQAPERKPNILVIMGDDVGWFNIGAYHQGIMSGKTPNLDKLAVARHAVHRLLCRGELHRGPGQLHHRRDSAAHRPDDGRPGRRRCRHAGPGRDARHRAQGAGLRDRPVRQEPSGRPEQVPADACTASTSSSATSITSTRCRIPYWYRLPAGLDRQSTARAIWCIAGRPTRTTRPMQPRWGKVGKQRIVDEGPLAPFPDMAGRAEHGRRAARPSTTWRPSTRCWSKASQRLHGQGQDRTASRSSSGTTRRACTSSPTSSPKYQAMMN